MLKGENKRGDKPQGIGVAALRRDAGAGHGRPKHPRTPSSRTFRLCPGLSSSAPLINFRSISFRGPRSTPPHSRPASNPPAMFSPRPHGSAASPLRDTAPWPAPCRAPTFPSSKPASTCTHGLLIHPSVRLLPRHRALSEPQEDTSRSDPSFVVLECQMMGSQFQIL
jgi:hypothetical protein